MPLTVEVLKGRFYPQAICDHCGSIITSAREGNYYWSYNQNPSSTWFLHKKCSRAFEASGVAGELPPCGELSWLPVMLASNLDVDWEETRDSLLRLVGL